MLARGSSVLEKGLFYGTLGTLRISRSCWSVDMFGVLRSDVGMRSQNVNLCGGAAEVSG